MWNDLAYGVLYLYTGALILLALSIIIGMIAWGISLK